MDIRMELPREAGPSVMEFFRGFCLNGGFAEDELPEWPERHNDWKAWARTLSGRESHLYRLEASAHFPAAHLGDSDEIGELTVRIRDKDADAFLDHSFYADFNVSLSLLQTGDWVVVLRQKTHEPRILDKLVRGLTLLAH